MIFDFFVGIYKMDPLMLLLISFAIIIVMVITLALLNVRRPCPEGKYSFDGKGSAMDPCQECDTSDALATLTRFPVGAYQCDLGKFDDSLGKIVGKVVEDVNGYNAAPSLIQMFGSDPSNMPSEQFAKKLFRKR
jgi:hypothetical protein